MAGLRSALFTLAVTLVATQTFGADAQRSLLQTPTLTPTLAPTSVTPSAAPSASPTTAAPTSDSVPPPVTSGGVFGELGPNDINATLALGGNDISANTAKGVALADSTELGTSLKSCYGIVPHYHPDASEIITVISGALQSCVFLNGVNACRTLQRGQAHFYPKAHLHWFWNYKNEQAVALSFLTSAAPGFYAYGNLTGFPQYTSGFFPVPANVSTALIASQTPTPNPPATFLPLTRSSCQSALDGKA